MGRGGAAFAVIEAKRSSWVPAQNGRERRSERHARGYHAGCTLQLLPLRTRAHAQARTEASEHHRHAHVARAAHVVLCRFRAGRDERSNATRGGGAVGSASVASATHRVRARPTRVLCLRVILQGCCGSSLRCHPCRPASSLSHFSLVCACVCVVVLWFELPLLKCFSCLIGALPHTHAHTRRAD